MADFGDYLQQMQGTYEAIRASGRSLYVIRESEADFYGKSMLIVGYQILKEMLRLMALLFYLMMIG